MFSGEFHALDSASRTAAELVERWVRGGESCVVAVEFAHARNQRALDAYLFGRIGERELRRRMRYREEWGYPWSGPGHLLRLARRHGVPLLGLDLSPRGSAGDLEHRDRVVAERLARLGDGPGAPRVVVVIGEAHLAQRHLPAALARIWSGAPGDFPRVLHDADGAWGVAPAPAWAASDGNAPWLHRRVYPRTRARWTALSRVYRQWADDPMDPGEIDLSMMVDGLIEAELRSVGIDPRRRRLAPGCWLPDLYPEVFPVAEAARIERRLREECWSAADTRAAIGEATARGALLLPREGVLIASGTALRPLALEAGRFGALAMRGTSRLVPERSFWERLAVQVLAFTLARSVDPGLPVASAGEAVAASKRSGLLARALGSWLGDALATAFRQGEVSSRTMQRWLSHSMTGAEDAVLWLRRAVRSV